MHKFIIDVNPPNGVQPFDNNNFIHVAELDIRLPDNQIWGFAKKHGYTING
jgi:hypothetical protein